MITEETQNVRNKTPGDRIAIENRVLLLFLGLLVIGVIGCFALRSLWMGSIFAHVGGVGIIGILSSLTGIIAKKKGYSYWKVFLIGLILPVCLGVIAVLLIEPISCGGSPSMGVALLLVIICSLIKRRDVNKRTVFMVLLVIAQM
jgi:hypothetical protein